MTEETPTPAPSKGRFEDLALLTTKQMLIMDLVMRGNGSDATGRFIPIDLDQLLERLPYKTSKQSMQFSIRALVGRRMLERSDRELRRGRSRVTLKPTELARKQFRLAMTPAWLLPAGEDSAPADAVASPSAVGRAVTDDSFVVNSDDFYPLPEGL